MRIDLALQGRQLTSPSFVLLPDNFLHQIPDAKVGSPDGTSQMSDLRRTGDRNLLRRSSLAFLWRLLILSHCVIQLQDRTRNLVCNGSADKEKNELRADDKEEDKIFFVTNSVGSRMVRDDPDQLPPRITKGPHHHRPLFPLKRSLMHPVGQGSVFPVVLFPQSA